MAKAGSRSLKAALFEAGLGEPPPEETRKYDKSAGAYRSDTDSRGLRARNGADGISADPQTATSQGLSLFRDLLSKRPLAEQQSHSGVVSPPPWVRAAKRGRRRARLTNTFGWVMTLAVVAGIIGVAGHYLAVPPLGLSSMQARP